MLLAVQCCACALNHPACAGVACAGVSCCALPHPPTQPRSALLCYAHAAAAAACCRPVDGKLALDREAVKAAAAAVESGECPNTELVSLTLSVWGLDCGRRGNQLADWASVIVLCWD